MSDKGRNGMGLKKIYDAKKDKDYQNPFHDKEEWRERILPDGKKIPFLYIHGGFEGTDVKFTFCYPEKKAYKGRFFQHLSPFPGPNEEDASLDKTGEDDRIAFAAAHGAYFVECNMGATEVFKNNSDPTIVYKSNSAAAEYSRVVAEKLYGCERPYGYVYGGSGGGFKTMSCIENSSAWDGAVPYVIGSPAALPNCLCIITHGLRVLRKSFDKIVDALEPGGSGDMYNELNADEKEALKEVTAMGFPPRTWFLAAEGIMNDGSLQVLMPGVKYNDPEYFKDFWEIPGYLGTDLNGSAVKDRILLRTSVKNVHIPGDEVKETAVDGRNGVNDAWQKMLTDGSTAWIEAEEVPTGENLYLNGVNIFVESGAAKGKNLWLGSIVDHKLVLGTCYGNENLRDVLSQIKVGDEIRLDNSDYLAIQTYYRHQMPDASFYPWDQFRDENGKPSLPQREKLLGRMLTYGGAGSVQDGDIQGKIIVVESVMDENAFPWQADWYRRKIEEVHNGNADSIMKIWYMDHCLHGDMASMEGTHYTNYVGALHQALLSLSDWVERGIEPVSSRYSIENAQVILPKTAEERGGIQSVVTLLANQSECAHVKVNETVKLEAIIEIPPRAGYAVSADFCFEDVPSDYTGQGIEIYRKRGILSKGTKENQTIAAITHSYEKPGTYFASVRVKNNASVDETHDVFLDVRNIARVRIIVEE